MATMYVNVPVAETVNVREEPDRNSRVLFTLPRGAQVTTWGTFKSTDGRNEQYYGINDSKGRDGCIKSEFLSSTYVDPGQPWLVRYGSTVWKRTLHENSSYSAVATLQRDLRADGYTSITNADGYYGPITEAAVKAFQSNNNLTVDGICGNSTKEKLWNLRFPSD